MKKRLLACLLTAAMLVSLFPLPALAAEAQRHEWMVTAFDPLDGDIAAQTVPQGGEPVLPDSLTAYAYVIEDDTAVILPSEELAQEDEQSQSDGPEGVQFKVDSTEEPPVPGEALAETIAENDPEPAEKQEPDIQPVTVPGVTWEAQPEFDPDAPGEYVYTPILPAAYEVAGEVELPVISVTVTAAEQTALQRVQAMIDTLPTAEELSGMSEDEQSEVYHALQAACDAYEALTDEQKEEITGAEIFDSLSAFFNGMVNLLEAKAEYNIGLEAVTIADVCGSGCSGHTITGASDANTIAVAGGDHDITLQSVNIDVSERYRTAAFSIAAGATVNLTLNGENTLKSGTFCAGLQVPNGATLVIAENSTGSLNATGGVYGAGIGGGDGGGGTITINGGTITATGGGLGAGIGGGYMGAGGEITISGGTVDATSDTGAGIGGGYMGAGGEINITGGTVDTTSNSGAGIGGGYSGAGGTFTANGNAFIVADSISDQSGKEDGTWKGVIFEGDAGQVYGDSITLTTDAEIPSDKELTIKDGQTLTVGDGVTLTNSGTINVEPGGNLEGDVVGGTVNGRPSSIENGPVTIADCVSGCLGHIITGTGTSTTNTITVLNGTHDITLRDVNIEISWPDSIAAFSIAAGATVNLTLNGENTLISGVGYAGLQVPDGAALVITKDSNGSLDTRGEGGGAGIGGGKGSAGGEITISGGRVNATAYVGAGIGGGDGGAGGEITINGGTVKAVSDSGAGIGGGSGGNGGEITISGGRVNATSEIGAGIGGGSKGDGGEITIKGGTVEASSNGGAGIGGGIAYGGYGAGGNITISGGTVKATSKGGAGIGGGGSASSGGDSGEDGTFAAGGNAFIIASSIGDNDNTDGWLGVIFEGDAGQVYGDSIILTTDAEIPSGKELTIKEGQTLTVGDGVTLTNNGTTTVEPGGKLNGEVGGTVNWPSTETGVTAVSVSGTAGSINGTQITVTLPFGTPLPTDSSAISITLADEKATVSNLVTVNNGAAWTFTVTAEDRTTKENYIIKVSVSADPAEENRADVAATKSTIKAQSWTVEQSTANTGDAVREWIENQLAAMSLSGVSCTVSITDFAAATSGSGTDENGTDGSFTFTVSLSKGAGNTLAEDTVTGIHGTITATPSAEYTVTFDAQGGMVIPATMKTAGGKLQSLPVPARSNYTFEGWFTQASGGEKVTTNTMFAADTTIYAHWKYSGGNSTGGGSWNTPPATYTVTAPNTANGQVTVSPTRAARGTVVTITAVPEDGYRLDTLNVTSGGKAIPLTEKGNGKYTFTMPTGTVKVEAVFVPTETPETPWDSPFTDVSEGDWYYEAVRFVQEQGLMNGIGNGNFAPNAQLSRAQLAQILFNKEGRPGVNYLLTFSDVAGEAWYTEAVRWAASQGIVGGYGNGTFGPNDPITREQLAVMLWRYSGSPAATNKELHFNDEAEISGFALEALRWAVENGILNGYGDGRLGPQGQATRAQVAQMLKNFIENQEDNI